MPQRKGQSVDEVTSKMAKLMNSSNKNDGSNKPKNFGRHEFLVSGNKFDIDTYYVPHKAVGSGAYGVVW